MNFFNETNKKRVEKIMETLQLISKSGNSNGADREHFQDLLEPVIQAMAELSPAVAYPQETQEQEQKQEPEKSQEPERKLTYKQATWDSVYEMAQEASLKDLTRAMAVYLNRIDEEFHERK